MIRDFEDGSYTLLVDEAICSAGGQASCGVKPIRAAVVTTVPTGERLERFDVS